MPLTTWPKILGHCKESDIKKLPNLVKGMKTKLTTDDALNSDICIQEKMSNDRNETLDCKATKIRALVHNDLLGPIQPLAKNGYKYVINFIDNYSDTFLATTKYLVDIDTYNHVKVYQTDYVMEFNSEPFQRLLVLNRI